MMNKSNFVCKKCGECCKPIVLLSSEDIEKIEDLGFSDFIDIDPLDGEDVKVLKQNDGVCMFLKGDKTCSIYGVRPKICKEYPFIEVEEVEDCKPNFFGE